MNTGKNKRVLFCFVVALLICCKDEVLDTTLENSNKFDMLLSDLLSMGECKNIFLIKKNDCLACEQITSKMLLDSALVEHSIFVNESIREIEMEGYISKHSYLLKSNNVVFDTEMIKQVSDLYNLKFDTSLLIVLDQKNNVVLKGRIKTLIGDNRLTQKVCK